MKNIQNADYAVVIDKLRGYVNRIKLLSGQYDWFEVNDEVNKIFAEAQPNLKEVLEILTDLNVIETRLDHVPDIEHTTSGWSSEEDWDGDIPQTVVKLFFRLK